MRKLPPIPDVPRTQDASRSRFDTAVKENLEVVTGRRLSALKLLEEGATLEQVIDKVNELIARLQGSDASTS